jgi:hypothetical protein
MVYRGKSQVPNFLAIVGGDVFGRLEVALKDDLRQVQCTRSNRRMRSNLCVSLAFDLATRRKQMNTMYICSRLRISHPSCSPVAIRPFPDRSPLAFTHH